MDLLKKDIRYTERAREEARKEANELDMQIKKVREENQNVKQESKKIKRQSERVTKLNEELREMIEQDREANKQEVQRIQKNLSLKAQKFETKTFLIKNRLHVLAQYLRVNLEAESEEIDEIVKEILNQVKQ